jgi:general secretion pathway protein F
MPMFRYEAVAASGEFVAGEMEAPGESDLVDRLQADGHVPIRIEIAARVGLPHLFARRSGRAGPRKSANLALLTHQLAILLHAGLSLDRALEIAQSVVPLRGEKEGVRDVLNRVRRGASLADAMAAQNGLFPGFYIGMVRAGEAGGSLDQTLRHLAEFLERSEAAREQAKSALMYPLIVLAVGCASIAVLFGFVIPRFRPLFEDAGTALPFAAQAVLAVADVFRDDWWVMLGGLALLAVLAVQQSHNAASRRRWDRLALRLPLLGELIVKTEVARLARTLGTLLKNGVPALVALSITEETIDNTALREAIAGLAGSVKEGKGLAEPLARIALMPPLVVQLTRVGEETARLEEMLLKLAEIYDQETRRSVERLLALLVPAITIALGALVALVIGSILTAILSVYDLAM